MPIRWLAPEEVYRINGIPMPQQPVPQQQQQQQAAQGTQQQGAASTSGFFMGGTSSAGQPQIGYATPPPYIASRYGIAALGLNEAQRSQWAAGMDASAMGDYDGEAPGGEMRVVFDPRYGYAMTGGDQEQQDIAKFTTNPNYMRQWEAGQRMAAERRGPPAVRQELPPVALQAQPVSAADAEREAAMQRALQLQAERQAFQRRA